MLIRAGRGRWRLRVGFLLVRSINFSLSFKYTRLLHSKNIPSSVLTEQPILLVSQRALPPDVPRSDDDEQAGAHSPGIRHNARHRGRCDVRVQNGLERGATDWSTRGGHWLRPNTGRQNCHHRRRLLWGRIT